MLLALLAVGCGEAPGQVAQLDPAGASGDTGVEEYAARRCGSDGLAFVREQYGDDAEAVAAHATTVAGFEEWADTRHGFGVQAPTLPGRADDTLALLCVYDGDFSRVPKGPPPGVEQQPITRLSIVTDRGSGFRLYEVGVREEMDLSDAPPLPPAGVSAEMTADP